MAQGGEGGGSPGAGASAWRAAAARAACAAAARCGGAGRARRAAPPPAAGCRRPRPAFHTTTTAHLAFPNVSTTAPHQPASVGCCLWPCGGARTGPRARARVRQGPPPASPPSRPSHLDGAPHGLHVLALRHEEPPAAPTEPLHGAVVRKHRRGAGAGRVRQRLRRSGPRPGRALQPRAVIMPRPGITTCVAGVPIPWCLASRGAKGTRLRPRHAPCATVDFPAPPLERLDRGARTCPSSRPSMAQLSSVCPSSSSASGHMHRRRCQLCAQAQRHSAARHLTHPVAARRPRRGVQTDANVTHDTHHLNQPERRGVPVQVHHVDHGGQPRRVQVRVVRVRHVVERLCRRR